MMDARKKTSGTRKGFFFTIATILLVIPLIFLLVYYFGTEQTRTEDTVGKVRCDELYYFVGDVERDLGRAMAIFGRRAAVYATNYVVTQGYGLKNYTFRNCTQFVYGETGADAAIAELVLCGTLNGENVSYMVEHTLLKWVELMNANGIYSNFNASITVKSLTVVQSDAWNFALIAKLEGNISDRNGMCFYSGEMDAESLTEITGLEDPSYSLNTDALVSKYIYGCTELANLTVVAGCSEDEGQGTGGGTVVLYSTIGGTPNALEDFCDDTPAENLSSMVLGMDQSFGSVCNKKIVDCLSIDSPKHFAALIEYGPSHDFAKNETCNITIPWISDTGDLSEYPGNPPREMDCGASNATNISDGYCILVKNEGGEHEVILGVNSSNLNYSCYYVSNITRYEHECSENYSDGASFFDRLDGNSNLTEKYANKTLQYFNTTQIGIESFINPYEFEEHGVGFDTERTWVDYLYWQGVRGCGASGVCKDDYQLKLDCPHARIYGLNLECLVSGNEPPVSVITYPAGGDVLDCTTHTIRGNASDPDGTVSFVEVSINGNWSVANGTTSWTFNWTPATDGNYTIRSRATDSNGSTEIPSGGVTVSVTGCGAVECPSGWVDVYNNGFTAYAANTTNGYTENDDDNFNNNGFVRTTGNITINSYVRESDEDPYGEESEDRTQYLTFFLMPQNCFKQVKVQWAAENHIRELSPDACGDWEVRGVLQHTGGTLTDILTQDPGGPDCMNEDDPISEGNSGTWNGNAPGSNKINGLKFEAWSEAFTIGPGFDESSSNTTFYVYRIEAKA